MSRRRAIAAGAALALLAGGAAAGPLEIETPWEICALCHSLDGVSRMARFPKLAGQKEAYILKQVRDVREGRRVNDGGQMQAVVTEVAEADLPAVAKWFASQPAPPPAAETEGDAAAGAKIYAERGCADCHEAETLPEGLNLPQGLTPPRLAAQHEGYLAKQLADFREGRRENDPGGVMRTRAAALTDADIAALAAFLASTPRE